MRSILTLLLLVCAALDAAENPGVTVVSIGSAPVTPTALHAWITLKEKGSDAAAIAQSLQAKRAKLEEKLIALGFKKELCSAELAAVEKNGQNYRQVMRSGGRLKRTPNAAEKPEMELSLQERIEIPLEKKDADGILIEAETLKAKLRGGKLLDEAPAEDDENQNMSGQEEPGPLSFMYFAPRSEEAQSAALAAALKKAAASAALAAKAAGKGGVELFSVNINSDDVQMEAQYDYNPYYQNSRRGAPEGGRHSATVKMQAAVSISAEFHFK